MSTKFSIKSLKIPALIIISLALVSAIVVAAQRWNKPLAPGLELPTFTPAITILNLTDTPGGIRNEVETAIVTVESAVEEINPEIAETDIPMPTMIAQKPEPLCGGPELMTVLALGIDTRADNYLYGLADVIRIVRVDFVEAKITALSLPRDLWVEIPGISDHYGITHGKLNQSYFYGTEGMGYYDGPGGPPGLMARSLALNFGFNVDHYGSVNMITFERMVDAVGGIDIYLPRPVDGRPVDDKTEDMGFFEAGNHHFTGEKALRFSRIRKVDTVFDRMDRQSMVICALKDKLLSPSVLPRIPQLITSFRESIITDLSPAQLSQLACLAPKIKKDNLLFASIPQELLTGSSQYDPRTETSTFVWDADYQIISNLISEFMNGTWPDKPEEPSCP